MVAPAKQPDTREALPIYDTAINFLSFLLEPPLQSITAPKGVLQLQPLYLSVIKTRRLTTDDEQRRRKLSKEGEKEIGEAIYIWEGAPFRRGRAPN
uniref:Uncharacterized protein n=1 Tax=Vibrio tapetis TaxID=52443 RepID=B2LS48_9VIBR|nr:hypothetical protein pVT1_2 [Vibrio tapetis]